MGRSGRPRRPRSPICRGGRCSRIRSFSSSSPRRSAATTTSRPRSFASSNLASSSGSRARISCRRSTIEGAASRQKAFQITGLPNETFNLFLGSFNLAWEIDIWGRIRRATESAQADYLGAEAFRRGVLLTLVSDVAQAYFELLELDRELEIARLSTHTFQNTLDLFTRQYEGGVGTRLEVSRGAAAVEEAAVTIPDIERAIVAKENQLRILLGRNPGGITARRAARRAGGRAGSARRAAGAAARASAGHPSQAEEAVVAANADVGVAVGNFFPRLGLTSLYGGLNPKSRTS